MAHEFRRDPNGVWVCAQCGRSFDLLVRELLTHPLALEAMAANTEWVGLLPELPRRVVAECGQAVPA